MDGYYAISEMAHMFDLSRQTLIYYDRIGLFHPAVVNDEGYRFYAPTQIPFLRLICLLRDMGVELKDIAAVMKQRDIAHIVECLDNQEQELATRIDKLERMRDLIGQRKRFYDVVAQWQSVGENPIIQYLPERVVVFEPWGIGGADMGRSELHPALMRAIQQLKTADDTAPVAGWGAMIPRESFGKDDVMEGAGSFVTVPDGVDASQLPGAVVLPAGEYACQCRWGMPYDPAGINRLLGWLREHKLDAADNAFDFCLLDTTSYTESHTEDFCVMQIRLAF